MLFKKFEYKVGVGNVMAVKEEMVKSIKGNVEKYNLSFGMDASFKPLVPCTFREKFCTNISELTPQGVSIWDYIKEHRSSIYYRLDQVTYICTVHITTESGVITKEAISLRCPAGFSGQGTILAKDVTASFDPNVRTALLNSLKSYVLGRF